MINPSAVSNSLSQTGSIFGFTLVQEPVVVLPCSVVSCCGFIYCLMISYLFCFFASSVSLTSNLTEDEPYFKYGTKDENLQLSLNLQATRNSSFPLEKYLK